MPDALQTAHTPNDVTAHVGAALASGDVGRVSLRTSPRGHQDGKKALLGKDRKSASSLDPEAVQNARFSQRSRRFQLQRTAGDLLGGNLSGCGRRRRRAVDEVRVMRSEDGGCHMTGLQRCGNVHACPVCAARIAQTRRMEAITALTSWRAAGGHVYMLTLTLPHDRLQALSDVLGAVSHATRYLNSGNHALSKLLRPYGYQGQIRSLEVTHGGNGWHPHLHVLLLVRSELPEVVGDVIKARWEKAVIAKGWAAPNWSVGATLQDGSKAAAYVNKEGTWGMAEEMTMHTTKKGRNGGRTPFELLQDAALGDRQASALFVEYGRAVAGKRQQFWSAGLKDFFGLRDLTDQEVADSEDADHQDAPEIVATVCADDWARVVRYEGRAELLRAAEVGGQLAVDFFLRTLFERMLSDLRPLRA